MPRPTDDTIEGSVPGEAGVAIDPVGLAMMQRIESALFGAPEAPIRVGRFALGRVLGSGGMGVVHLAHDDVLHRRVAIKLIRSERVQSTELRLLLLREARAMARLSHPNVVQVYEAGEHDGQVFVAMELVEGRTLGSWLAADGMQQPWRQRLAVLVAAGRGLAAAHGVGLVHRDFKPENVLLDRRGDVKVADFGLVGVATDAPSDATTESDLDSPTVTGALVGTPRYMAPEQLMGRAADARSDQFAFCVVAYQVLVGQRPFAGETFTELSRNVTSGALRPVPRGCRVPRSVLDVIERGLATDPARRWPSMDALLGAMSRHPRRWRAIAAIAIVATMPTLAIMWGAPAELDACDAKERMAAAWSPSRREQTSAAYQASTRPFAADTFARVAPELDAYASAWVDADLAACALEQGGDDGARLRRGCLEHARAELQLVTDDLVAGQPQALVNGSELVGALPDLARCDDPERAVLDVGSLEDPQLAAIVDGLAHAKVLVGSRRLAEADALLVELQQRASQRQRDVLEGHALVLRSSIALNGGAFERAHEHATAALVLAERSGRDELALAAWRALSTASRGLEELDRAEFELDRAQWLAHLEPEGGDMPALLRYDRATLLFGLGRHREAVDEYRGAFADLRAVDPDHRAIMDLHLDMCSALLMVGEQTEAISLIEESIALRARLLGDAHPTMVVALSLAANHHAAAGRFEDALRLNQRALALAKQYPEQRPDSIPMLAAFAGQNLVSLARFDEAERMFEHAAQLLTEHAPHDRHAQAYVDLSLASLHIDRRQFERAVADLEPLTKSLGDEWTNRAVATANLAYALAELGRFDEALARAAEAMEATQSLATDSPLRVGIEIYVAEVHRLAGRHEEARARLQQVLPVLDGIEADPGLRFMGHFGAAQLESDPAVALAHATRAAEALERMHGASWQRDALTQWRAQHGDRALHAP